MENRQNEEAQKARKPKNESKEKQAAEEENIHANVQAAQAAAKAVLKTPFMKQNSSATSKKQRTPTQRLVAGAQGEGLGEVMSPRARDALISDIAQCIAQEAFHTFRPQVTQMPMAIVTPFQRQTTQVRMAMTTMMTTTQSQGTVSAISSSQDSDIIILRGLNQQAQRRRLQAFDYDSFMSNLLSELKKKKK